MKSAGSWLRWIFLDQDAAWIVGFRGEQGGSVGWWTVGV